MSSQKKCSTSHRLICISIGAIYSSRIYWRKRPAFRRCNGISANRFIQQTHKSFIFSFSAQLNSRVTCIRMNGRHWFEVQANNLFIFTEIFLLLSWDAWKNRILTRTRINSSLSVRCSLSLFRWNSSDSNFCLFGGRTPRGGAVPRRQLLNRLAGGDVSLLFIHSLGSFLWMTFVNESYVTPSSDWHSIPSNSNDLKFN